MKISILHYTNSIIDLNKIFGMQRMELGEIRELEQIGIDATLYAREVLGSHPRIVTLPYAPCDRALYDIPYYTRFVDAASDSDILQGNATPLLAAFYPEKTIIRFDGPVDFEFADKESIKIKYIDAHYIFVSEYLKRHYKNRYHWIPETKCHTLYNAVDMAYPKENRRRKKKKKMLFCSRWVAEKGIFIIRDVLRQLAERRKDWEAYIAGGVHTKHKEQVNTELEDISSNIFSQVPNVNLVGYLEHGALLDLIKEMDFLLFPSIWGEPFGLVPAEAAMVSVPTIAFAVGALPEVVQHRQTGLLLKKSCYHKLNVRRYLSAVEYFLDNPSDVERMGVQARQRCISKFTWRKYTDNLLKIYETVKTKRVPVKNK